MILLLAATVLFLFSSPDLNRIGFACIALGMFFAVKRLLKQYTLNKETEKMPAAKTAERTPVAKTTEGMSAAETGSDLESAEPALESKADLPLTNVYQKKWLFSFNEKNAYAKLKPMAEELGYTVFAKVRLLDLLEPKKDSQMYRSYFNKVQAKHVDFVLCDKKMVARIIIELDDSSHNSPDRQERDSFVDTILKDVGYRIIHRWAITDDLKNLLAG